MRIGCLAFLLMTLHGGSLAYAQSPDAVVVSVSGRALVREAKNAITRPLKKGDNLSAGQRVICADGCEELIISYCKVRVPVTSGPKGRLIVSINCKALDGVRAGGAKGEAVAIISPKESEVVHPETFVVRWEPSRSSIKLALRVYLGEKIWGPQSVDGSKGSYTEHSLVTVLKNAQKAGDLFLVLMLDDGNEPMQRVKFNLLSALDQQRMDEELRVFGEETDPVLKALGRGMVFGEFELYVETVKEFEKALAASKALTTDKDSLIELRELAIRANYKAYNDERVRQLCRSSNLLASRLPQLCSP